VLRPPVPLPRRQPVHRGHRAGLGLQVMSRM
jgi:hypothetical protein